MTNSHSGNSAKKLSQDDLAQCASENLRNIGLIQSYGFLLVFDPDDYKVCQYSTNFEDFFQVTADDIVGKPINHFTSWGDDQIKSFLKILENQRYIYIKKVTIDLNSEFDWTCQLHKSNRLVICEFMPINAESTTPDDLYTSSFAEIISIIRNSKNLSALLDRIAREFRRFTGYDRVMIYKFSPDWSGEVIAESTSRFLKKQYLGLHFPASDIPSQARELYTSSYIRLLVDVKAEAARIFPVNQPASASLDLSNCLLRAMSKYHLSYLSNMGVKATLTLSLLDRGKLWGLITCHHMSEKIISQDVLIKLNEQYRYLAETIIYTIKDHENDLVQNRRQDLLRFINKSALTLSVNDFDAIDFQVLLKEALKVFNAGLIGLYVHRTSYFEVLSDKNIDSRVLFKDISNRFDYFIKNNPLECQIDNDLLKQENNALESAPEYASILIIPLTCDKDAFLFLLREEFVREVRWGGEPDKVIIKETSGGTVLEPRNSFSEWIETIRGEAIPWTPDESDYFKEFAILLDKLFTDSANKQKSQFLAKMSHELRTPMHAINSFTKLALKQDIDPKAQRFLENIAISTNRLTGLLNDLLDLAKLETGKIDLNCFTYDVSEIIKETVISLDGLLKNKNISIHTDFIQENHADLDKNLIIQVLTNLISNAIKFSPVEGNITVSTEVASRDNRSCLKISVEDEGQGIAKNELESIFNPFIQGGRLKDKPEGTGLGLSICKEIMGLHHGEIWAESPPAGKTAGSVFTIMLPIKHS